MTLTTLLRIAPIRNAVLGPSAESLRVSYRNVGISVRVVNDRTPEEKSTHILPLDPIYLFDEDRYAAALATTEYVVAELAPAEMTFPAPILAVETTTASAMISYEARTPISIEVQDA